MTHNNINKATVMKPTGANRNAMIDRLTGAIQDKIQEMFSTALPEEYIVGKLSRLRLDRYTSYPFNRIVTHLAMLLYKDYRSRQSTDAVYKAMEKELDPSNIEVKRKQLVNVNVKDLLGVRTAKELRAAVNPLAGCLHSYLVLDSKNRLVVEDGEFKQIVWNYSGDIHLQDGLSNTQIPIKNVVCARLHQSILPKSVLNSSGIAIDVSALSRVSVLIYEFRAQSYIANASRNYHFITAPIAAINSTKFVELQVENFIKGEFWFRLPIVEFSTITMTIGDPLNVLSMPDDRFKCASVGYSPTTIVFVAPNDTGLTGSQRIYVSGFTTLIPTNATDKATTELVNSPLGIQTTATLVAGATNFTYTITTALVDPDPAVKPTVFMGTNRAIFTMEILHLPD